MQDQWSTYYQGQAAPQASASNASYDYSQAQQPPVVHQQQSPDQLHRQHPTPATMAMQQRQMQYNPPGYLMPQLYTGDPTLSLSMRSGTSSSICSSMSSASGHPSPTSMRASMSSSTTGPAPSTPSSSTSLPSPFFTNKESTSQDSWFGSLQDSFLSSQQVPSYTSQDATRPALYRMDRMSISSPIPSASMEGPSWNANSMSPHQRTPRRASVAVFQDSPTHQTPTYNTQQVILNPQSLYQPSPQTLSYTQPSQTWTQVSSFPAFQPNYAYQIPPTNASSSSMDMRTSCGPSSSSGMGIDMSQSYYPSQASWQRQSAIPHASSSENYNFAGVLLETDDLHLLGPDPLSPTAAPAPQPAYSPTKSGWQSTFSFGTETTPKAIQPATMQTFIQQHDPVPDFQPQQNWNFATFHGFTPLATVAVSQPLAERAASAPPPLEIQPVLMPSAVGEDMNRRRGSSVDSPSMLPFQLSTYPLPTLSPPRPKRASYQSSPVYLGKGPAKVPRLSIATRRATIGPSPLDLAKPLSSQSSPLSHSSSMDYASAALSPSAPIVATVPASPTRRRNNRRSMAPTFINFTTKDAKKLLSGVAPSGSSKRKREEEEARNQGKHVKIDVEGKDEAGIVENTGSPSPA